MDGGAAAAAVVVPSDCTTAMIELPGRAAYLLEAVRRFSLFRARARAAATGLRGTTGHDVRPGVPYRARPAPTVLSDFLARLPAVLFISRVAFLRP